MLRRDGDSVSADPPAFGVREWLGVLWLAPAEPADVPLEVPEARDRRFVTGWMEPVRSPRRAPADAPGEGREAGDRRFVTGWMEPVRSPGPAGPLADTFLDATHGPFVHAATIGAPDRAEMPAPQVVTEPGGFSSVQE